MDRIDGGVSDATALYVYAKDLDALTIDREKEKKTLALDTEEKMGKETVYWQLIGSFERDKLDTCGDNQSILLHSCVKTTAGDAKSLFCILKGVEQIKYITGF